MSRPSEGNGRVPAQLPDEAAEMAAGLPSRATPIELCGTVNAEQKKPADETKETLTPADISRLAKLPFIAYEGERRTVARRYCIRLSSLDRIIENARWAAGGGDGRQGTAIQFPEPPCWPGPVEGAALLANLSSGIRRYVVMDERAADAAALWVLHTYLLEATNITPRLVVVSPEKRCGKTTMLDVLQCLVWRPLAAANVSTASVFRIVETHRPTLLIDEADAFLHQREELRGILNSGHRRGGTVLRVVGDEHEPRAFSTFSACAIASIGRLPATLEDRSIVISLRRRRPDEGIVSFRLDRTDDLRVLARQAVRWATDNVESVKAADPDTPSSLYNRAADNWHTLFAISDTAGGEWPQRTRRAALHLSSIAGDDQSIGATLLSDIRDIFAACGADRLTSEDIVERLADIEGRPWAEWNHCKLISKHSLARLLKPFGIAPCVFRMGGKTPRGYQRSQFEETFTRYLPSDGGEQTATVQQTR
jgi:putative DNA primase/helicase